MKAYILEYDFEAMSFKLNELNEHRIESYTDVTEFINRVKYVNGQSYMYNLKTYSGELNEIDVDRVLSPL